MGTADGAGTRAAHAHGAAFQPEIQGLRAVSVLAVVAAHAGLPGLPGGFTGVDVFFVISGFLITRLLLAELARSGRIDLLDFWARRVRRLLPNAAAALIGTVVLATFAFPGYSLTALVEEVTYAALNLANFHFAQKAVDYFRADGPASPVLHFWSLSVEEQFYIVWPPLLAMIGLAGRRSVWPVLAVLAVIWCASLAACLILTKAQQPVAYFGTGTRCWQLATGALLAAGWPGVMRLPALLRHAMAWAGLAAILAGLVLLDGHHYPGSGALLPTLGAAMLIAGFGAADRDGLLRRGLAARPMQWIGARSYSWYLWHWPLLILPKMAYPEYAWSPLLAVPVSLAVACAAYAWIETPLRAPRSGAAPRPGYALAGAVATLALVIGAAHMAAPALQVLDKPLARRLAKIRAASGDMTMAVRSKCHLDRNVTAQPDCLFGDARGARKAVLFGDSHAFHWFVGLDKAARQMGWQLRSWTKSACPSAEVAINYGGYYAPCAEWREAMLTRLTGPDRPDLVILSNSTRNLDRIGDPVTGVPFAREEAARLFADGMRKTIDRLLAAGVQVAVIRDTPLADRHYRACLVRGDACATPREAALAGPAMDADVARELGFRITYLDLTDVICDAEACPAMRGKVIVYRDVDHLTATYAASLAPKLSALFRLPPRPVAREERLVAKVDSAALYTGYSEFGRAEP